MSSVAVVIPISDPMASDAVIVESNVPARENSSPPVCRVENSCTRWWSVGKLASMIITAIAAITKIDRGVVDFINLKSQC